jgi:hypothetical protein
MSKILRIGFTGTQKGMSLTQKENLRAYLTISVQNDSPCEFHHGDCIGADAEAHVFARDLGIPIIVHPPINYSKRAFTTGYARIEAPREYLVRNHDIVDATDLLFVAPFTNEEELRSGTWATYRYAKKLGKNIILLYKEWNE